MTINIKAVATWIATKINKYPVLTRVLTQVIAFITTFGWHNSSPFWHVVCIASLAVMSVLNISDAKLRKGTIEKSDQVVDILQGAIVDMVEAGAVEIGDFSIMQPDSEPETASQQENQEPQEETIQVTEEPQEPTKEEITTEETSEDTPEKEN